MCCATNGTISWRRAFASESVKAEFLAHANEEQAHADADRRPHRAAWRRTGFDPEGLASRSHSEYVEGDSLRDMIKEDLVAERVAIESYREIIAWLEAGTRRPGRCSKESSPSKRSTPRTWRRCSPASRTEYGNRTSTLTRSARIRVSDAADRKTVAAPMRGARSRADTGRRQPLTTIRLETCNESNQDPNQKDRQRQKQQGGGDQDEQRRQHQQDDDTHRPGKDPYIQEDDSVTDVETDRKGRPPKVEDKPR